MGGQTLRNIHYKETTPPLNGPHEAGLVLEEFINIHNSASNDSLDFRVISILRSGENFHYGPPNNRYFHVDFREDQKFKRDVTILLHILKLPFTNQKSISKVAFNPSLFFKSNSRSNHKAIEYINDISSDQEVRLLGYNTLRDALNNATQALVVTLQLDERMQELSNEDTIRRIEKVALSYHHGTDSQKKLLEPIFQIGLFAVARRNGKINEAHKIAQTIPSLQVRALLIAVLIEDQYKKGPSDNI